MVPSPPSHPRYCSWTSSAKTRQAVHARFAFMAGQGEESPRASAGRKHQSKSPKSPSGPNRLRARSHRDRQEPAAAARVTDDENDEDEDDSDYSTVSEEELPLIHAFGHTYHGTGTILTPNDESERRRLDLQHSIYKMCLDGRLTSAVLPADRPLSILDVGTGTGVWALEMGEQYPLAHVAAVDVSAALLPTEVPRNVVFEIEDAAEPWGRPRDSLDFVHLRNLVGGGISDWRTLLEQTFQHLRPGGQVEFAEIRTQWYDFDDSGDEEGSASPSSGNGGRPRSPTAAREPGSTCRRFERLFAQIARSQGVDFDPTPKIPALMSEVGFDKVIETSDLVPIRAWGNDEKTRRKGAAFGLHHTLGESRNEALPCGLLWWTLD